MRIDPETCRDPGLLAKEVRRLNAVIAAGESAGLSQKCDCPAPDNAARQDMLTDEEREAIAGAIAAEHGRGAWAWAATLRGLLERLG
jgi:hypothetical protein